MNDKLKATLEFLDDNLWVKHGNNYQKSITDKECKLVLDYITNLEEDLIYYQRYGADMLHKNNILEERIEKAVEYIENNEVCCLEYIGRNEITGNLEKQIQRDLVNRTDLLNILNGRSDK